MKKGILAAMLILCILLGAGVAVIYITGDRQGPKITIPDADVTYVEGTDTDALLEGVQAVDQKDGDVTDSLVIEYILPDVNKTKASVVYAARDKQNNVTKKSRIIEYQANGAAAAEAYAEDQENLQTETPAGETNGEGNPEETVDSSTEITAPASSSDGEAANEAAIAALPAGSPRFYLTEYELTIPVGSTFYALSYVKEIQDDKDTKEKLYRNIQIEGEVHSSTAGTYEVRYHVVDSDGNNSNTAVLKVTVQ